MPIRAFSIEDGNLGSKTILTSRTKSSKDIDLSFANKPSGDVFKKEDAAAVKQAVRNLLLTNFTERPFMHRFGGNLSAMLFRLSTEIDDVNLESDIARAIEMFEPRARVINITSVVSPDRHEVRVKVNFLIVATLQQDSVELNLTRLR